MNEHWTQLHDRLPATAAVFEAGLADGLHPGAQIYVSLDGETVADAALGEARPGTPMTPNSIALWMSMGKPLTAALVAKLVDQDILKVDQHVADWIDGFEVGGKGDVTIAHVLTHTGGFRNVGSNWSSEPWAKVIDRIAASPLEENWIPGETAGYHVASGWYILADICRRTLDVEPTDAAMMAMYQRELLDPLGMTDAWIGMPRPRYLDYGNRLAYDTSRDERKPMTFPNTEAGFTLCRPGGNARGPVRAMGRFYEQLLVDRGELAGDPWLRESTARMFTARQRVGLKDRTFGATIDWGYGFLLNDASGRRIPYGYGPHASPDTFGHSGNQSSCAFADPRHKLVVAWLTNGLPGELAHQRRQTAVNTAVYEDLGVA